MPPRAEKGSGKRRRSSKRSRPSVQVEVSEEASAEPAPPSDGAAAAAAAPAAKPAAKKARRSGPAHEDDPFNTRAAADHLGLDVQPDGEPSGAPAAAAAAPAEAASGAAAARPDERRWFSFSPERVTRLGRDGRSVRALLRLLEAECVSLGGFYRVRVLRGGVRIGGYLIRPSDGWQPVQAASGTVPCIQASDESGASAADGQQSVGGAEGSAAAALWQISPAGAGAVISLESLDGSAGSGEGEEETEAELEALPPVEGKRGQDLALGLELCHLAPPPGSAATTATNKRPLLPPPEWEQGVRNVCRMHSLALLSNTAAPPITLVAGAKNAGKSTFCRLLLNSLLAQRPSADQSLAEGEGRGCGMVAYLDLDPGQCEFTASGMLSLVVVLDRNVYQEPGAAAAGKSEVPAVLKHLDANLPRGNFAIACPLENWRGESTMTKTNLLTIYQSEPPSA